VNPTLARRTCCPRPAGARGPALFLAGLAMAAGCSKESAGTAPGKGPDSAPVPVTVAPVVRQTTPVEVRTFGTVQANLTVAIKPQITGVLTTIHFKEGENVKQGDLLFTIDPRPFEAALRQAEANLARDTAQQKNAETEASRQEDLLKKGVAAQGEFDQARTTADALAAVIRADQAAIDNAKIQLGYCRISSPIDGRTGAWLVDQGNLAKAEVDVALVVINQVRPIQVNFSVPQRDLEAVKDRMAKGKPEVQASVPGQDRPEIGQLTFIDNTVDRTTGTFRLKATFPNPQERLWPGQYVDIVLVLAKDPDAIVVPAQAVQTGQEGQYVFVVTNDQTVEKRPVTVARTVGNDAVVSKGLEAGEQVVTDGQLRLVPKAKIRIKNASGGSEGPRS